MDDNFDMLIVDINTLKTIYTKYFTQQVILNCTNTLNLQEVMRVNRTFGKRITGKDILTISNLNMRSEKIGRASCRERV